MPRKPDGKKLTRNQTRRQKYKNLAGEGPSLAFLAKKTAAEIKRGGPFEFYNKPSRSNYY